MKYFTSIRTQLLLAITITLFIFLLVAMGGVYLFQKDALTKESIKKVTELDRMLKAGLKSQMFTHNAALTQTMVNEIKSFGNISDIYIINTDGVVKFSPDPAHVGKVLHKDGDECRQCHHDATGKNNLTLQTRNSHGVSILRNVTHIYNETVCFPCHPASQKILGLLFVDYETAETDQLIAATLWRFFLTAVAAFFVISGVILFITNRLIHRPIAILIDGTNAIKNGNYKEQINCEGYAEFNILADSFNEMSRNIVRHIREIKSKSFELSVLYAIVKKIGETIYLEELKIIVIDLLLEVLECNQCTVITPTGEPQTFEIIVKGKGEAPVKSTFHYPETDGAVSVLKDKPVFEPFVRWVSQKLTSPELADDALAAHIPLFIHELPLGLVIAQRNTDNPFDEEGFRLITVVREHLAVAFENARLYTMAITDELTRLFTIRHFQAQMEMQVSRFMRYGQKYSLLMMDIDDFKRVNDTYGHPAGDQVLKEVAAVIRECLRDIDIPCRYGGEEFAVILPETSETGTLLVAERIRTSVEKRMIELGSDTRIAITISIGGASCPQNGTEARDIILSADKALYAAKESGKNRSVIAS